MLSGEETDTNYTVFDMIRSRLANHYVTDAVSYTRNLDVIYMSINVFNDFVFTIFLLYFETILTLWVLSLKMVSLTACKKIFAEINFYLEFLVARRFLSVDRVKEKILIFLRQIQTSTQCRIYHCT